MEKKVRNLEKIRAAMRDAAERMNRLVPVPTPKDATFSSLPEGGYIEPYLPFDEALDGARMVNKNLEGYTDYERVRHLSEDQAKYALWCLVAIFGSGSPNNRIASMVFSRALGKGRTFSVEEGILLASQLLWADNAKLMAEGHEALGNDLEGYDFEKAAATEKEAMEQLSKIEGLEKHLTKVITDAVEEAADSLGVKVERL